MTTYFPYSQIITFLNEVTVKHPYFCGWSVQAVEVEQSEAVIAEPATEIYY